MKCQLFDSYLSTFLAKSKTTDKIFFLVEDLNLNLVDYQSNAKVTNFKSCKLNMST